MTIQFNGLERITPESFREMMGQMGLTDAQRTKRGRGIGGSDAAKIMSGNWHDLWLEKCGHKAPDDLSEVFHVQLGNWTEPFNKAFYALQTGRDVISTSETYAHPEHEWMLANLDGRTKSISGEDAVFEAKHVNAFSKLDEVAARYFPQAQHYLAVTGLDVVVFSVIVGPNAPETFEIKRDNSYIGKLIEREKLFWWHVTNNQPPMTEDAIETPAFSLDEMRTVSMQGNNAWSSFAADWLLHKDSAKTFEKAAKELKGMVETDVKLATGHGIKIMRAKNGNLSIKEG
jgi:predicted phage-related endonuclease